MNKLIPTKTHFALKDFILRIKDIPKNLANNENKTRMIISLVPFLEKALFYNKDKEEIEKIWTYLCDLSEQINNFNKETINFDFMGTPEFYNLLKRVIEQIKFEYKYEKIKLFRNFILNTIRKDKPKINFHYFLSKIIDLEIEHFEIIEWYHKNDYVRGRSVGSEYDAKKMEELSKISKYYGALEIDLNNCGFLSLIKVDSNSKRYILAKPGQEFFDFIKYDDTFND